MQWRRIILVAALLLLIGLPLAATHRLLYSEAGLRFALAQLSRIPAVRIEVTGASGTLAGPLAVQRVLVEHEAVRIEARGLRLDARLRSLLGGNVYLEQAGADSVEVVSSGVRNGRASSRISCRASSTSRLPDCGWPTSR